MRRYLVVANQTLGGPKLADKLRECMSAGPCRFYLVVPATPTSQFLEPISQPLSLAAVDGGGGMLPDYRKIAEVVARRRLDQELARLREAGAEADGEVGDSRPLHAIRDRLKLWAASVEEPAHSLGSRWTRSSCPPFPTACRAGWSPTCHTAHGAPDSQ